MSHEEVFFDDDTVNTTVNNNKVTDTTTEDVEIKDPLKLYSDIIGVQITEDDIVPTLSSVQDLFKSLKTNPDPVPEQQEFINFKFIENKKKITDALTNTTGNMSILQPVSDKVGNKIITLTPFKYKEYVEIPRSPEFYIVDNFDSSIGLTVEEVD